MFQAEDELDGGEVGSMGWLERLQMLDDDVIGLLSDMLREKWQAMTGDAIRSDWAALVRREYSPSELAAWRERLADSYAQSISTEQREQFQAQARREREGPRSMPNTH